MLILRIRARNVNDVVAQGYDSVRIYRDTLPTGTFATVAGTVPLVQNQEWYEFVDAVGDSTSWYELTYLRVAPPPPSVQETSKSTAFRGIPALGPLQVLTIDYVWATTDIPAILNLPASKVGELIIRAETEILNYAKRFGAGINTAATNFGTVMPIVARILLEEIYLRSRPTARARVAGNLVSEKIGNYSYTTRAGQITDASYWTPEIINLLTDFLLGRRLDTSITTTQVFPEVRAFENPLAHQQDGVAVKTWNDLLDSDFMGPNVFASLRMGPSGVIIGPGGFSVRENWWDT